MRRREAVIAVLDQSQLDIGAGQKIDPELLGPDRDKRRLLRPRGDEVRACTGHWVIPRFLEKPRTELLWSKPMGTADAEWNSVQAQANSTLGMALVLQAKYEDSIPVLEAALKLNKKDDQSHYNLGLAYSNQLPQSQRAALDAFNAENAAKRARKDQFEIDELAAIASARQGEFNTKRDMAIEAFGKAVAVAGPYSPPARQQLERLWKQKNNESLDGLEAYIAQKKTELGD
jgi:hypothetical protein